MPCLPGPLAGCTYRQLHKEQKIDAPIVTNRGWSACYQQSKSSNKSIYEVKSVIVNDTPEYEDMETEMKDIPEVLKKNG